MMENLILLGFGSVSICVFILATQVFVWVWDCWDKRQKRKARRYKIHQEPRIKEREDYWAA